MSLALTEMALPILPHSPAPLNTRLVPSNSCTFSAPHLHRPLAAQLSKIISIILHLAHSLLQCGFPWTRRHT